MKTIYIFMALVISFFSFSGAYSQLLMDDDFSGTDIDHSKWFIFSDNDGGSLIQNDKIYWNHEGSLGHTGHGLITIMNFDNAGKYIIEGDYEATDGYKVLSGGESGTGINITSINSSREPQYFGEALPHICIGFSGNISYKGYSFNTTIDLTTKNLIPPSKPSGAHNDIFYWLDSKIVHLRIEIDTDNKYIKCWANNASETFSEGSFTDDIWDSILRGTNQFKIEEFRSWSRRTSKYFEHRLDNWSIKSYPDCIEYDMQTDPGFASDPHDSDNYYDSSNKWYQFQYAEVAGEDALRNIYKRIPTITGNFSIEFQVEFLNTGYSVEIGLCSDKIRDNFIGVKWYDKDREKILTSLFHNNQHMSNHGKILRDSNPNNTGYYVIVQRIGTDVYYELWDESKTTLYSSQTYFLDNVDIMNYFLIYCFPDQHSGEIGEGKIKYVKICLRAELPIVTTPYRPVGPSNGKVGQSLTFKTGGSICNLGHSVEYQFDWGDGTKSNWGPLTQSHSYSSSGTKYIKARARCGTHTSVISAWSNTKTISVSYCMLSVNVSPSGSGSISKEPDKTNYTYNENVVLTAHANSGYQFNHWGGDLSDSDNPKSITMNGDKTVTAYFIPISIPPVIISTPDRALTGEEIWIDINVGSNDRPINDLKVISFELEYTNTSLIEYVSYNVGTFISGAQATVLPDNQNGIISASVYRFSGGNSGHGTVLRLKFKISTSAQQGQSVCFNIQNVQANSSNGSSIPVSQSGPSCIEIDVGKLVWPGDANDDGIVNIFDINYVVAVYWNLTGPPRPNPSINWYPQPCPPWDPVEATYADCNGDGIINIFDINPIIVNFQKTKDIIITSSENIFTNNTVTSNPPISVIERDYDDDSDEFWIDIKVGLDNQPVNDLKVVSFELTYSNTTNIDYISYVTGSFISGAQATLVADDQSGKISASVYRLYGGTSGNGVIISLKFKAQEGHTVDIAFEKVMANSSNGGTINFAPFGKTIITNVENSIALTNTFVLHQNYPNPFNPTTEINYELDQSVYVELYIFDTLGHVVRKLVAERQPAGIHTVIWDATNDYGQKASSGIYYYKIIAGDKTDLKRMVLLK